MLPKRSVTALGITKRLHTGFRRQKNNNDKNNNDSVPDTEFAVTSFIIKREISPAAHAAGLFIGRHFAGNGRSDTGIIHPSTTGADHE